MQITRKHHKANKKCDYESQRSITSKGKSNDRSIQEKNTKGFGSLNHFPTIFIHTVLQENRHCQSQKLDGHGKRCFWRLTIILAARELEDPWLEKALRATSAAECSAWRRVERNSGLSKFSPLKLTIALNRGV